MSIHFYLRYKTAFGQTLWISGNCPELGNGFRENALPLSYVNDEFWRVIVPINPEKCTLVQWSYFLKDSSGQIVEEWGGDRKLDLKGLKKSTVQCIDTWNPAGGTENVFFTKPFAEIFAPVSPKALPQKPAASFTHIFRIKAPLLGPDESVVLLGDGPGLRQWSETNPIPMEQAGHWWSAACALGGSDFPLGYKYAIWNAKTKTLARFEDGPNRLLYDNGIDTKLTVLHDGFFRQTNKTFKGAGVAIPVFSLRTEKSWGVGEFSDLKALADWSKSVGLKLIQLLPINDTTATHTWTDSYPYAAVSAYALHPLYVNVEEMAGKEGKAVVKPYAKEIAALNGLDQVDYEAVMRLKWACVKAIFEKQQKDFVKNAAFVAFFAENKHWLEPYGVFCCLRDQNGTPDFTQWKTDQVFNAKTIQAYCTPGHALYNTVLLHWFVQFHLHLQLKNAVDYCHNLGIALKGDIPIGIYRYSCDAWMAPELYHMDMQAGAPPDDFAEKGQNWGFPTYNWERMKADGFAWWRSRFQQMSHYFDAFRIDHILGFFRIWSIPMDAVEGIMGRFVPALPLLVEDFQKQGIGVDESRLTEPFITDHILWEMFGDGAATIAQVFLQPRPSGGYALQPAFNTQRKIEAIWASEEAFSGPLAAVQNWDRNALKQGLFDLISNVILFRDAETGGYHFRYGMEKTASYRALPDWVKSPLYQLYLHYFYKKQDDFWEKQAMEKLPDLKKSTEMLICGEDLGMVPNCVPGVMKGLGILSLEIQRMPKETGIAFFEPRNAPYLSVVTPSTHDMSTVRGWWEEDPELTRRFFNQILGYHGSAPIYCEPWICEAILKQHFYAPAMWAIFQLQDLMGIQAGLRRENPADERINVPANPKHYWRYRMHHTLEDLQTAKLFNQNLKELVHNSGRG